VFQKIRTYIGFWVCVLSFICVQPIKASTLTGSFSPIAQGSNVNLTAVGTLDWVHWGLLNMYSVNRKSTVPQQISNFTLIYDTNSISTDAYQYTDNYNGYSWFDGAPSAGVTNTTTGLYVVGSFNVTEVVGFQITVPADTTQKTLQVFVGAYSARGKLAAYLSDSTTGYTNTSLSNNGNGPGGVYTINFASGSSNQTLTVKWTLSQKNLGATDANVTLQAATLSAAGVDNPPFAKITVPSGGASFTAPATITLNSTASDADGTISKVEYYHEGTKIGQATGSAGQYSYSWNNVPAGRYVITAKATDNGGAVSTSSPITVFVNTNGGTLSGSVALPPASVDLTSEGNLDWAHWGLISANSFDHKAGVAQQIGNLTKVGTNALQRLADNYSSFGWNDGTPTPSTNSNSGVFLYGPTNGFQFTVPADTNPRTLKVYVGGYASAGSLQAYLSDFSAPAFADTSVSNMSGNSYAVYTLNYSAASSGQTLNVLYSSLAQFDQTYGNVTLEAASLAGVAPVVVMLQHPSSDGSLFSFSFSTDVNRSYTVQYAASLTSPVSWQTQTNVIGDGTTMTVTIPLSSTGARFYRVQSP
jgi:Bacterial Ig domain